MQLRALLAVLGAGVAALTTSGCTPAPANPASPDMAEAPFVGSGLGPDEIPLRVDLHCPGAAGCPDTGDGQLLAAAAVRDITPVVEPFVDKNGNGVYDYDEPFTDLNGNGQFDPVWIAGYGSGRQAYGVHDPVWLRCYVLRQNQTTLAHCVVDGVGYFQNEEQQIRADLPPGLDIDLVMMGASHLHETKDTVGIWGPNDVTSGYDADYMRSIRQKAVSAIVECVQHLRPAKMSIASIQVEDANHDLAAYVSDTRDPVVIDNTMHLMQFDGVDGKPIGTVLVWAGHPESAGSENHYLTADYTFWLRSEVEQHTGSPVIFVNADVGGQIGPGRMQPRLRDGTQVTGGKSFLFAQAWGEALADFANKAFDQREAVDAPKLAFWHTTFNVHVENVVYHTGFFLHLFNRSIFGYDPHVQIGRYDDVDNIPLVQSEAAYITLGPASISTCPGELLPENFLGGYDGQHAGTYKFVDTTKPNFPDVTKAPGPPYLVDLMQGPAKHRMIYGLTLDFLGYIIPRYNWAVDALSPYLVEAKGDHYEETNSVGPRAEPEIVGTMRQLVLRANAEAGK